MTANTKDKTSKSDVISRDAPIIGIGRLLFTMYYGGIGY